MVPTILHHLTRQTAKGWRSGLPVMALIAGIAVFLLTITTGRLQAEESSDLLNARKKLLSMVKGDITRSLAAVETAGVEPSGVRSLLSADAGFPSSIVYGMGANNFGKLGVGTASDTNIPIPLAPDVFGGPIAAGADHTLVVDKDGNLWAAGDDTKDQFGEGPTDSSTMTIFQTSATGIKSVAAGENHSLILTDDGTVKSAGKGDLGQLGNGGITDTDTFTAINITDAAKVAAYENSSFVITDLGELFCFGLNDYGQLGTDDTMEVTPVSVLGNRVVDVAPGLTHTLALMADGSVMAAGMNNFGQFGDGTTDSSYTFKVVVPSNVKAIAAGNSFSLFLMADGSLYGVGYNGYGQLGTGDTIVKYALDTPIATNVAAIAAGHNHSLYVTNSGALWGMGNNAYGELGLGDFSIRLTPTTIEPSGVAGVTAGDNNTFYTINSINSIEIKGLATVYEGAIANFDCYAHWADGTTTLVTQKVVWSEDSENAAIELNTGILDLTAATAPETIRITAGYFGLTATRDVIVIKPLGSALYGCGDSFFSQLGLDTTVDQPAIVDISSDKVISLAGGLHHSLYVREDGSVFAMGDNSYGQLGTGDMLYRSSPAQLALAGPAIGVGAGDNHSFIIFRDGSLWTMGLNSQGQLGDGTLENRSSPTKIHHAGVIQADGGTGHSVFLTADGEVWTMGFNDEGQLGTDTTANSPLPCLVHANADNKAAAVAAGDKHTLFRTADTALWGMGDNSQGQLGLGGGIFSQASPTMLAAGNVAHFAAGGNHTLYVSLDNVLYVSGYNFYGQLGNNDPGTDVTTFTQLSGYTGVTEVYAGANFSKFATDDSVMGYNWYGMGDNTDGQLGNGTFISSAVPVILPHNNITRLALGADHALFTQASLEAAEIRGLDQVYESGFANFDCLLLWDNGSASIITDSAIWSEDSGTTTIDTGGLLDLSAATEGETIQITGSFNGFTAFKDVTVIKPPSGCALYGYGDSEYNQLGLDNTTDQLTPVNISQDQVISAAGGKGHSLYVLEDGSVYAMGDNRAGQLGVGDTSARTEAILVSLPRSAVSVAAGDDHSLIVCRDGSLFSMGNNTYGQLGTGDTNQRLTPTKVFNSGVVQADGGAGHTVFLTADGEVWTMGDNAYGQLGNYTGIQQSTVPFPAYIGTKKTTHIAAGARHTIFRTNDTAMRGMGDNSEGQLGLGDGISTRNCPTLLVPTDVAVIAAAGNHTLYTSTDQLLFITGGNDDGQLGNDDSGSNVLTFTQLEGYTNVTDIIAGANFSMFRTGSLTADHIWYGMGNYDDGQLGLGITGTTPVPVMLPHSSVNKNHLVVAGDKHTFLFRSGLPGDIDGDLQITLADTVAALKILAESYQGSIASFADVNGDGKIDFYEANYALRKAGGL